MNPEKSITGGKIKTVFNIDNNRVSNQHIRFLKDRVTLKTGVMADVVFLYFCSNRCRLDEQ